MQASYTWPSLRTQNSHAIKKLLFLLFKSSLTPIYTSLLGLMYKTQGLLLAGVGSTLSVAGSAPGLPPATAGTPEAGWMPMPPSALGTQRQQADLWACALFGLLGDAVAGAGEPSRWPETKVKGHRKGWRGDSCSGHRTPMWLTGLLDVTPGFTGQLPQDQQIRSPCHPGSAEAGPSCQLQAMAQPLVALPGQA